MRNRVITLFMLFLLSVPAVKALDNTLTDSLEKILKTSKNDTDKVKVLNAIAWQYSLTDLKKARAYCYKSIELSTKLNFYKGRSSIYNTLGNVSSDENNNSDALKYYFLSAKDKERIHDEKGLASVYNNIGIVYVIKADYANALKYYNIALTKRELLNDKKGIADCYNNMGNIYRQKAQYADALSSFNKAYEIQSQIDNEIGVAFVLNNIATVYDDKADFASSLKYRYRSAAILEKKKDEKSLIRVYNNIGSLNRKLKNYDGAIKYSLLALNIAENIGDKNYKTNCYENLGAVYIATKNYVKARPYFEKGLILAQQAGNKDSESFFYSCLGLCCENSKDFEAAEINFKKGSEIGEQTGIPATMVRYSNALAEFYVRMKNNRQAEFFLNKSITISKKNGLRNDLKKAYISYADYYQNNGEIPKAFEYLKLYKRLNDSLYSEDIIQKFTEQQTRYETEKKENEIKFLKQQEEIKSLQLKDQQVLLEKRKWLLIAVIIFIILTSIAGYFYFSSLRIKSLLKQDQLVREAEENERSRLSKDIHDDLGSGLSKIKFLSEIISANPDQNPAIKSNIKSISETAVSLLDNMRDLIWALNPENTTLESLITRMREYSSDYLSDFNIDLRFDIGETFPDKKITKEAHRNIFFILKECLQNIVKHAEASAVTIKIATASNEFQLAITDNGKGLTGKSNGTGNGLRNIRQRAETIGAAAEIKAEAGRDFIIVVTVPFKNIEKTS